MKEIINPKNKEKENLYDSLYNITKINKMGIFVV